MHGCISIADQAIDVFAIRWKEAQAKPQFGLELACVKDQRFRLDGK